MQILSTGKRKTIPRTGAEDFIAQEGGYEIITSAEKFSAVSEALEKAGIARASAEITMLLQTYSKLSTPEEIKQMNKMLDLLDDEDAVQSVYHNLED